MIQSGSQKEDYCIKLHVFAAQLVMTYVTNNRDSPELLTVACRLLLDAMPGMEMSVVFQDNVSGC